jgi:hypothetical protein
LAVWRQNGCKHDATSYRKPVSHPSIANNPAI